MASIEIDSTSIVGPLDENVLKRFTAALRRDGGALKDFRFDPSYLAFLQSTNGGVPAKKVFDTRLVNDRVVERFLHMCDLPSGHPLGASSVPVSFFLTQDRLHRRLVPFADLFAGDMLCFDYADLRNGRPAVVVWMHDDCFEDEFMVDFVSDDFDAFAQSLRVSVPIQEFSRTSVAAWPVSGILHAERIRDAMDIDPASICGPLDEKLLERWERVLAEHKQLGLEEIDIDPTYAAFLRRFDGGLPRRPRISVPRVGTVRVTHFGHLATFRYDDPRRDTSAWAIWLVNQHGIARQLLPFATCDGKRVLCFDYSRLTGKRPAIVVSETTGNRDPDSENRGANYPVAENFDALLDLKWF